MTILRTIKVTILHSQDVHLFNERIENIESRDDTLYISTDGVNYKSCDSDYVCRWVLLLRKVIIKSSWNHAQSQNFAEGLSSFPNQGFNEWRKI